MINEVQFIVKRGENYSLIAKIMELIVEFLIDEFQRNQGIKIIANFNFYWRAGKTLIAIKKLVTEHRRNPKKHEIAMEKFIHFDNLLT